MEKVKVGIAGLGRLGKVHAGNIAYKFQMRSLQQPARSCRLNLNMPRRNSV